MNSGNIYKYKFLSEPNDTLKCLICLDIAEEPWQHDGCGRLFCKECLDKYGRVKPCPHCKRKWPQYFADSRSKREIRSLHVKCHNVEHACPWEGTVGTVEKHVATTCQFTLLPCPNKCKDCSMNDHSMNANFSWLFSYKTKHLMRKDLEHHLKEDCPNRHYKCAYCGEEDTYVSITEVHDKVCKKKPIPCSNTGCTEKIQRQHISKDIEFECEHTVIACKHKSIGCDKKLKRKDMPAHELDDKFHLRMAINTITRLEKEKGDLVLKKGEVMNFRFIHYKVRKESNMQFTSPSFYTSQGYHMALRVDPNGCGSGENSHVSVFAEIVKGKHDAHLHWPFLGSITFTVLNQLEDKNHHIKQLALTNEQNMIVGRNWGYLKLIPHSALGHNRLKNMQYLKDDTLYFKVEVEEQDSKPWLQCTNNI